MANYYGKVRTNYFSVKDEEKFKELTDKLTAEDEILVEKNSKGKWSIASHASIDYCKDEEDCDYDLDVFLKGIQECIADDDAMIWTEIGNEKLRYFVAYSIVVTSKEIKCVNLEEIALNTASEMLGKDNFKTEMYF